MIIIIITTIRFNSTLQCGRCLVYLQPHNPRGWNVAVPAFVLVLSLVFSTQDLYYWGQFKKNNDNNNNSNNNNNMAFCHQEIPLWRDALVLADYALATMTNYYCCWNGAIAFMNISEHIHSRLAACILLFNFGILWQWLCARGPKGNKVVGKQQWKWYNVQHYPPNVDDRSRHADYRHIDP